MATRSIGGHPLKKTAPSLDMLDAHGLVRGEIGQESNRGVVEGADKNFFRNHGDSIIATA